MVTLMEQALPDDRARLFEDIKRSNPAKAALIKARLLTVEKIYALDDETLGRILEDLDTKVFGLTLRGLDIELRMRALDLVSSEKRKKALETTKKSDTTEMELESAKRLLVQKARELESAGKVHFGSIMAKPYLKAA
jgi:flagellar motor switch protein FliG